MAFSRLETEARDILIDKAEEYFNVPIRKKIWSQTVTELVSRRGLKIAPACRLFGHCRQAYYQSKADIENELLFNKRLIADVEEIRSEDPRIGAYKLWLMLCAVYGAGEPARPGQVL